MEQSDTIARLRELRAACKNLRHDVGMGARCYAEGRYHDNALEPASAAMVRRDLEHAERILQSATYAAQAGELLTETDRQQAEEVEHRA